MRNLLLFLLILVAIYYVRRKLPRSGADSARSADWDEQRTTGRGKSTGAQIEQMVACAHCGLHVPESEGVRGADGFFCSEAHRRLGAR